MAAQKREPPGNVNEELAALVDQLAAKYARLCWWADEDDVRQEAWAMALRIRANFDATKAPGGIKAYARRGLGFAISRHIMTLYAPVSASDHGRYNLIGLRYAPVEEADRADERTAESALAVKRWRARVTVRLREVVGPEAAQAVLDAADEGASVATLARRAKTAVNAIAEDAELLDLWEDRER